MNRTLNFLLNYMLYLYGKYGAHRYEKGPARRHKTYTPFSCAYAK